MSAEIFIQLSDIPPSSDGPPNRILSNVLMSPDLYIEAYSFTSSTWALSSGADSKFVDLVLLANSKPPFIIPIYASIGNCQTY